MKTNDVSQGVEADATPPSPVGSVSVGISPDVAPGGDHIAVLDTEQVDLSAVKGTKKNLQHWVMKKRGSQVGEPNQLKLKVVGLYDGIGKKIHMTQLVRFVAVGWYRLMVEIFGAHLDELCVIWSRWAWVHKQP